MRVIRGALFLGAALAVAPLAKASEIDLADLFAKTSPSVVKLTTYNSTGGKIGQGSGFIVDKSGVVVTCYHVIAEAAIVEIQSADDSTHTATAIIRIDKDWDVALLKIDPLPEPALKLAPPEAIRVGAAVAAIGSPLGYGNTLSQGIISGLRPHEGKSDMIIQITTTDRILTSRFRPGSSASNSKRSATRPNRNSKTSRPR
jgi:S1-C subfamily serine protease